MQKHIDPKLPELVEQAFKRFDALPPEDQALHHLAQKASFAYGQQSVSGQMQMTQQDVNVLAVQKTVEDLHDGLPKGARQLLNHFRHNHYLPEQHAYLYVLRALGLVYATGTNALTHYYTTYLGEAYLKWVDADCKWSTSPRVPATLFLRQA